MSESDLPLGAHPSFAGGSTRAVERRETPKDDTLGFDRANLAVLRRLASLLSR